MGRSIIEMQTPILRGRMTYLPLSGRGFVFRESAIESSSTVSDLSSLSDRQLLGSIARLRKRERDSVLSMLLHIIEVESRGLDLSGGYSSIFDFCVRALKYSESVANRRIRAARCIKRYPAVYEYLSSGRVNICNVSKISRIMKRENHIELLERISGLSTREVDFLVSEHSPATVIRDRVIPVKVMEKVTVEVEEDVSDVADGKTPRRKDADAPELAMEEIPGTKGARLEGGKKFTASAGGKNPCTSAGTRTGEADRVKVKQKFKLQFAVSPEFMEKYEQVKELLSTKHPRGMDFECVFEACLDEYIERRSPEARQRRREKRKARAAIRSKKPDLKRVKPAAKEPFDKEPRAGEASPARISTRAGEASPARIGTSRRKARKLKEPSRRIPARVRDEVYKRDKGCCAYRGPGGRLCGSKWNLEIDHIVPFALGGSSEPGNLQLLCRRHNQHKAEMEFGKGAGKKRPGNG